jgi:glycine/D-amino acid oxidase-like deaminating enzyme
VAPLPRAAWSAEIFSNNAPYLACQRMGAGMRVAVFGTGIAGNAAAWALSKRYPVTVYDRDIRPGGHSHTHSDALPKASAIAVVAQGRASGAAREWRRCESRIQYRLGERRTPRLY